MNKQQLATKIWESANKMRSKIEANEYKDYILGFIFYKYLSDQEIKFLKSQDYTDEDLESIVEDDEETVSFIQQNIGYFISYDNLFSTWLKKRNDFDVSNVRDALSAFSRLINPTHKKVFEKIFDTLQTGLSKLGDSSGAQTKAIAGLLDLIKDIPMDGKQDYDVLGFIYEYLISMFAANAGKKAGEFYTPHEVSLFMSEIVAHHLKDKKEIQIYDPTSGSGSLLINIGRSVAKHIDDANNIKYFAQELKENTYNLTRMNLVMRGILPDNIVTRNGDTLEEDWPYFDESDPISTYNPLYVDAVVSNPPYSQNWDPSNKENNPRFKGYGLAPKGKADYAFLLHDLYHIKPDGIMTIVLPHGVLFRGGEEAEIRKNLIEKNNIDAIIGLPANIFFGTGIPTIIMVLRQKRERNDVLIVDASKGFVKVGKNNKLRASDIKKMVDTVVNRLDVDKYSRVVSRDEIRANDYNLNIPRYVDSSEAPETWDIYASMFGGIPPHEVLELNKYWKAFPSLQENIFAQNSSGYYSVLHQDVKSVTNENVDIVSFKNKYKEAFSDLKNILKQHLISNMNTVNVAKEENVLSENIFSRLQNIPLIDKYNAYQILDDEWFKIAIDLEIIQTEGFTSTKKVDPNIVIKKKDGKEQEVQEGWIGRVLPFDLIQQTILKTETDALVSKNNRVAEISSLYEEILDSLSEDEKENSIVNDDKDAFVAAEITKAVKQIKAEYKGVKFEEDTYEYKVLKVADLIAEEKDLKSKIKKETADLQMKTKDIIENLTDEQVLELLEIKWINPLVSALDKLPDSIIHELSIKIKALAEKYAVTFSEVEEEIVDTEATLSSMIDELVGNEFDMKGLEEFKSLLKGA
ncbi:MAG: type I restriction-modification system subunit M [Alphaproteobacteria bacterium]|nr:type I restriction-modification system subunit M [Alphaproteobacteria bacterium]